MGNCKYCGKPAGFLNKKHSECENLHLQGLDNIKEMIKAFIHNDQPVGTIDSRLSILENNYFVYQKESLIQIINSIKDEINLLLNTKEMPENVINKIITLKNFLGSKYIDTINKEFDNEKFSENQKANIGGRNLEILQITDSMMLVKDLESNRLEVVHTKDSIEFLLNKYSDSSYKKFKEYLFNQLITYSNELLIEKTNPELLEKEILIRLKNYDLNEQQLKSIILKSLGKYIENLLEDNLINKDTEEYTLAVKKYFSFNQEEIDENGFYTQFVKSFVIRDILEGKLPKRCNVTNKLPFNLQKNESLIWLINDVKYYEEKEKREYIGGHQGISIKIANGFYYRAGAFKGKPISTIAKDYISNELKY